MTDIVERLRERADSTDQFYGSGDEAIDRDAIVEIERLREQLKLAVWTDSEHCKLVEADNAKLRKALCDMVDVGSADDYREIALEALGLSKW